jgi:4-carboxymuconolactone decarboxylase
MARIPFVTRDDVEESERAAYDAFVAMRAERPNKGPTGPFALLGHMPGLAHRLESYRLAIRDESSLSKSLQELVMITVAREMDCDYIWYAHAAAARSAGVNPQVIDAIRDRDTPDGLSAQEQIAFDFARDLLRTRRVDDALFAEAQRQFGRRGVLALVHLVGCYAMLAFAMNALELEAPGDATEPPLPR